LTNSRPRMDGARSQHRWIGTNVRRFFVSFASSRFFVLLFVFTFLMIIIVDRSYSSSAAQLVHSHDSRRHCRRSPRPLSFSLFQQAFIIISKHSSSASIHHLQAFYAVEGERDCHFDCSVSGRSIHTAGLGQMNENRKCCCLAWYELRKKGRSRDRPDHALFKGGVNGRGNDGNKSGSIAATGCTNGAFFGPIVVAPGKGGSLWSLAAGRLCIGRKVVRLVIRRTQVKSTLTKRPHSESRRRLDVCDV
jgi:hypothetical protein